MNKKLLICGAIAVSLVLSACVKKETPAEEEKTSVETTQPEAKPEPKFENLTPTESTEAQVNQQPTQKVEIIREETANTSTEIRRETRPVEPKPEPKPELKSEPKPEPKPQVGSEPKPEPKPEVKSEPKPEPKPAAPSNSNAAQSQDDAVAAAIAAATPALD